MSAPVANPVGGAGVGTGTGGATSPSKSAAKRTPSLWVSTASVVGLFVAIFVVALVSRKFGDSPKISEGLSPEEQLAKLPIVKDEGIIGGRYSFRYVLSIEDNETHRVISGYDRYWRSADDGEKEESSSASSDEEPTPTSTKSEDSAGMRFERVFPKNEGTPAASLPAKPEVEAPLPEQGPVVPKAKEVEEKKKSPPPAKKKVEKPPKSAVRHVLYGKCPCGRLFPPCVCPAVPYKHCHPCCGVVVKWVWVLEETATRPGHVHISPH